MQTEILQKVYENGWLNEKGMDELINRLSEEK